MASHAIYGSGDIAMLFEYLRKQTYSIRNGCSSTNIDDIVRNRFFPAEHGGEAWMGGNVRRVAALEQYSLSSNAVDKRTGAFSISIASQVVCSLGVEGDQDDIHQPLTSSMVPFCQERIAPSMTSCAASPSSPDASSGPPAMTCSTNLLMRLRNVSLKLPIPPIIEFSKTSLSGLRRGKNSIFW